MVFSLHFKYLIASIAAFALIWSLFAPTVMKKANRHSPAMTDLQQVETEWKAVTHASLMKVKNNARHRRVKIRQLKYTCEAKIHVAVTGRGENSAEEERKKSIVLVDDTAGEVREPMKISLSLTTSAGGDRSLVVQGDAVLEETGDREKLSYGSVSVIGSRKEMEDEVSVEIGFVVEESGSKCDFFAVYDGHGGPQVAKACRERLHQLVAEEVERHRSGDEVCWEGMMEGCFGKMDREVADDAAVRMVGSTAIVAVVTEDQVVIANCGDCRAVMGRGCETLVLSVDHKPDRPDELMRIEAAGGRVINWNGQRVLGVLATSRSIGDQYLRPYIISKPEVTVTKRTSEDEFLILASDGLWDVISSEVACLVVRKCFSRQIRRISTDQGGNRSRAAEAAALLVKLALAKGSRDNTSVVVVELNNQNNL